MTTQLSIHNCKSVKTDGVKDTNNNALTLTVETQSYFGELPHRIVLYGLPFHIANAIDGLLNCEDIKPPLDEAAIRADERAKVVASFQGILANLSPQKAKS